MHTYVCILYVPLIYYIISFVFADKNKKFEKGKKQST